jgi:hypothetical protein
MRSNRLFRFAASFNFIFLGLLFFTAGMGKIFAAHAFPGLMGPVWLAERLAEYQLQLFGEFVAVSQILIGFSLVTSRFRTIGVLMLIPMLLNILMITISMHWRGTPYVISFFLIQLAYLIWFESPKLIHLLSGKLVIEQTDLHEKSVQGTLTWLGGLFLIYTGVFISHQFGLIPAYIIVIIGLTMGIFSYKLDGTKQVE